MRPDNLFCDAKALTKKKRKMFIGMLQNYLYFFILNQLPAGSDKKDRYFWGNILPHVQYHCLVRPSFPTCAVPPIIFELSVPIFRHVQYHPNISEL